MYIAVHVSRKSSKIMAMTYDAGTGETKVYEDVTVAFTQRLWRSEKAKLVFNTSIENSATGQHIFHSLVGSRSDYQIVPQASQNVSDIEMVLDTIAYALRTDNQTLQ